MPNNEHMSVLQAAEILGESRATTVRRIRAGELKAETIGRTYVLNRRDVDKLASTRLSQLRKQAAAIELATAPKVAS